jgi:hypothetical protein
MQAKDAASAPDPDRSSTDRDFARVNTASGLQSGAPDAARQPPSVARRAGGFAKGTGRWIRRWWRTQVASVPWVALLSTLSILVLGGWVTDALKGDPLFTGVPWLRDHQWAVRIGLVAVLIFLAWRVFLSRRELMSVGALSQGAAEPRRALILPLSPAGAVIGREPDGRLRIQRVRGGVPVGEPVFLQGRAEALDQDIQTLDALNRWPWQQLLRSIGPHRQSLRRLHLLGSSGTGGSHADIDSARKLLLPYLPNCVAPTASDPVDFDDLKAMMKALRRAVGDLAAERDSSTGRRIREEDIVIDVTGGYKPTSIAGAIMTLSSNVTFQYVHTSGTNQVREYELLHRGSGEA